MKEESYFDEDTMLPLEISVASKRVDFSFPSTYGLNKLTAESLMEWLDFNESLVPPMWRDPKMKEYFHIADLDEYGILMSLFIHMTAEKDKYAKAIRNKKPTNRSK